jgi:hypothetical protein
MTTNEIPRGTRIRVTLTFGRTSKSIGIFYAGDEGTITRPCIGDPLGRYHVDFGDACNHSDHAEVCQGHCALMAPSEFEVI